MRGAPSPAARGGPAFIPSNEATAKSYAHPAPYEGWNARGNLANMKSTEALQLDNIFPGVQDVQIRLGSVNWATAAPATIRSLLAYSGATTNKLFAATNAGIYDVTTSGAFGASVVACTNGNWHSLNMVTAGGNFLFGVNGTDLAKTFDGALWAEPAITGVTSSTWNYVALHKHRIWAVEKNTTNLWYLPIDSIAGAATKFPVGALFRKGGYVVAIGSWTLDGGSGSDDFFVIVTSNGQIAVYQGTDPASASTWALVGVYEIAKPIGDRPLMNFGGDLLCLTATGIVPMSQLSQSVTLSRSTLISSRIDGAFLDAAADYGTQSGWCMVLHKSANLLLINIPILTDVSSYQFAMNTTSQAWCRFTGWNASCWADFNNELYYAGGTTVVKAWTGTTDAGSAITGICAQAYSPLGRRGQKQVSLVRPNIGVSGAAQLTYSLDADFKSFNGETIITYQPVASAGIWDSSLYDSSFWEGTAASFNPKWTTVPGDLGYLHSFRLQIVSSSGNFVWTSTDFAYRTAGIL